MIKAVLFDADGVVLKPAKKLFTDRLKEEYQIEVPDYFFKEDYPKIRLGQASLETELKKRVKKWGWEKSVEELLDYWWAPSNIINPQVLTLVNNLRQKGIRCFIASDDNQYHADEVENNILGKYFDGGFYSCYLGYAKEDEEFYQAVIDKTGLKPQEILFVDDEEENVAAAKKYGLKTHHYQNYKNLVKKLKEVGLKV
jgi:putative hydrolase of the HAD superfamily